MATHCCWGVFSSLELVQTLPPNPAQWTVALALSNSRISKIENGSFLGLGLLDVHGHSGISGLVVCVAAGVHVGVCGSCCCRSHFEVCGS